MENRMDDRPRRVGGPPGLFVGLVIVTLGVIFLLDQQGIFPAHSAFHFFWTAVIIFWGVQIVVHARSGSGQLWGAFLILLGAIFLANELGMLHIHIAALWPLALIAFGVWTLLRGRGMVHSGPGTSDWRDWGRKDRAPFAPTGVSCASEPGTQTSDPAAQAPDERDAEFNQTAVFSGFKRRITSKHFKYAKVATAFGGFNIDLTRADMDGNQAVIHVDSVFGGGEIRVPDTWNVQIDASALAGAFVDETYPRPADVKPLKNLIVRGNVVFGGVVIKN
jgi:LiaF transmembrane domain/Cell wall-active antibiotics response LiaF, C-terminal